MGKIKLAKPLPFTIKAPFRQRIWWKMTGKMPGTGTLIVRPGESPPNGANELLTKMYATGTKFKVIIGPSDDPDDPRAEVWEEARVCSIDFDPVSGLTYDIGFVSYRPWRKGLMKRIFGA